MKVRVRIAPSPTGEDLHIGNVYTALLNYVFAKKHNGKFIVRIEDTDRTRLVEGSEERILKSLRWLNLIYDEGPDIGGPFAPYRQSERLPLYRKYAEELVEKGNAYYCFCTAERLIEMRRTQKTKRELPLYDRLCRKIKPGDGKSRKEKEKYVIRLKIPEKGTTTFHDLIRGDISFENNLLDDQVLLKSDGFPTYHLAVVVDDHLMEISHVIRAEDWISSTPKHVLLFRYFGWQLPVFVHGPLLRNPDKSKLSKRENPVWVSWYKEEGFLPEAILNYLALMGWSHPEEKDIFSLEEFTDKFTLEDLKAVGPAFDLTKLEWLNGEYIRKLDESELKSRILNFYDRELPQNIVGKSVPLVRERIKKLSDYMPLCQFLFERPEKYEMDLKPYDDLLKSAGDRLKKITKWNASEIGETMVQFAEEKKIKNSGFFMVLRVAVSGRKITPPLNESLEILGKKEVFYRCQNF
ncbi:glutamate--tRNA ligase [Candidatus Gottesmanbacteria bacterium RIFCSPLOWO2_02_FULL_42_29]|uniref:Glutamate--tRNA ligase n=1 Tax=Candidatus Gottesmanbacteria bacterium GW2011_GWA2_42_18 TaxID=1618442 RepID=A0A0G0ZDE1_9BACT|nr:MAG: Glutamate-tRNA ligase [Candidatus Gottesmanbacteria bacterium GW2011_GWA2_42_18]KKS74010.1 MAG: Glutamate-tRNA ligase [Candidatus Gottesmanbacteria bacterium GW2011_GWC2_42_8]OGG09971.1 MAG: glutamate--tRNA ligase [Candidatus Gottesmanbacteria bacterium RIFCSPHIGHO2_01_FULL_42_27]OGG22050.1 MAG: glutamate--tRNA ligase [Candidatus Gottesmanbacteria bacterium RIFCSPHIGHO2_12_FULL_43_26]OGG35667.1 MAG: glutamate--tRNA ligase [Candidatus Gottesmanbacteria bacterium RIFCSPLOWO2_12_FULL_42_10